MDIFFFLDHQEQTCSLTKSDLQPPNLGRQIINLTPKGQNNHQTPGSVQNPFHRGQRSLE